MKTIVASPVLKKAMQHAVKAWKKSTPLPILDCFQCEVIGNKLTLTVSDLETTVSVTIPCEAWKGDFSFCMPIRDMKLVEKMDECALTLQVQKNELIISSDADKFKTFSEDVINYPRLPEIKKEVGKIESDFFSEVKMSLKYVGNDVMRPQYSGVFFEVCANDVYKLAVTDAEWLRVATLKGELQFDEKQNSKGNYLNSFLMPSKFCKLAGDYKDSEEITVRCNEEKTVFSISFVHNDIYEIVISSRVGDGEFPNYKGVIPFDSSITATYEIKKLLKVLDKALVAANPSTFMGCFCINGETKVIAEDADFKREYTGFVSSTHTGDNIEIGLDMSRLNDILKDLTEETVKMEMSHPSSAIVMREKNTLTLLMPRIL